MTHADGETMSDALHALAVKTLCAARGWSDLGALNDGTSSRIARDGREGVFVTRLHRSRTASLDMLHKACLFAARHAQPALATVVVNVEVPQMFKDILVRDTGVELVDGRDLVKIASEVDISTLSQVHQAIHDSYR